MSEMWKLFPIDNKEHQNDVNEIVLVFLLLTLNGFFTFPAGFPLLTLNKKFSS